MLHLIGGLCVITGSAVVGLQMVHSVENAGGVEANACLPAGCGAGAQLPGALTWRNCWKN